jgi:hypothetical protein
MNATEFRRTTILAQPPAGLSLASQALWWDAKGDWTHAHQCAQQDEGPAGSSVHAYLHRKEGDLSNAAYWYRRAGRTRPEVQLDAEWEALVEELA